MQSSDALAMLPESVVRDHVKAGLLHALPLVVGQGQRAFSLFTPKDDEAVRGCAVVVAQV
jgi:DNA-binding transcriptional LysR family regulator